jgi:hypothetical protein
MIRTHTIKLDPTHDQKIFFNRCVYDSHFAWNWALEEWKGGGDIEDFGAWEVIPIFTSERRSIVTKTF